MKILLNLIVLAIIVAGAVYFYEQNRDQLNQTLDDVKNASVESVTEAVIEKAKNIDTKELLDLALDNKDQLLKLMDESDISLESIDKDKLKAILDEKGISLDSIDLKSTEVKEELKKVLQSAQR